MEEFVTNHGSILRRLIGSLVAWNGDEDDLLQETLLRVWKQSSSYRGDAPFKHWMTRIAVRVCRNHQRTMRRYLKRLKTLWSFAPDSMSNAIPQEDVRWEKMQFVMTKLPYRDRELIVLHYLEQHTLESIAMDLGVRIESLHIRLHRSRERLKSLMEESTP